MSRKMAHAIEISDFLHFQILSRQKQQLRTVAASVMGGSCGRRKYGCNSLARRVLLRGVNRMGDIMGGGCTSAHRLAGAKDRGVST